jgi:hypothetical protein
MRYTVNANTFMQLPYTTGTVQNVSNTDIEISNEQTVGTGIVLKAGETFAFNNATVYACARPVLNGGTGIISVVPFNGEGEGGESPIYVPKGSVAFASLPTTLNSTMLGWTYNVSDAFTTDNRFVEGSGVDYPAGENVVVVEASTGVFKYDCFGGAYILPVANTTTLGGVKSSAVDGKVSVDNDGVMTINLPTASTTVKGGTKIGTGLSMSGEVLNLDVASTSALGGIKVGTGVEVANEKLNVKVATATEVAGVLSSADEGKVTVNNDGTMTYNPLGYRQPSTSYTVGNIAYHSALPTGWYLECTTEGTTGSGALTISSPAVGGTVTDGTVTWTIDNLSSYLPLRGGKLTGSLIGRTTNDNVLELQSGQSLSDGASLTLCGKDYAYPNLFILRSGNNTLQGTPQGGLNWAGNDLAGSAIVAKSLGTTGYIKYASGLIMQWGNAYDPSATNYLFTLPISFTSAARVVAIGQDTGIGLISANMSGLSQIYFVVQNANHYINWFAIGY